MCKVTILFAVAGLLVSCGEPEPGRSRLILNSTPSAEVFLNGESVGESPLDLRRKPGHYQVVFKREGFDDYEDSFPLPAWAEVKITAELVTADPPEDLLTEMKEVTADLLAFFAELGVEPPGALAEVVTVADSGKVPACGAELERYRTMLNAMAGAIETVGTDDALAARVRSLADRLQ